MPSEKILKYCILVFFTLLQSRIPYGACLMKTNSSLVFSPLVQPAQFLNDEQIPKDAVTYSWGYRKSTIQTATVLRKKPIKLLNTEECKAEKNNQEVQKFDDVTQICGRPSFLCYNDFGSPTFALINKTSVLIGIASHPDYCNFQGPFNAIYIKITQDLRSWMSSVDQTITI